MAAQVGILPALPAGLANGDDRPHLPLFEDAADVHADRPGMWFPVVDVGQSVSEGTLLGRLEDAFGDAVQEILAPVAGVVTFGLGSLAAGPGDLLASIAPLAGQARIQLTPRLVAIRARARRSMS
jgi:predicted deacylase